MRFIPTTYFAAETPVHRVDARVKIVLLVAFSVGLFFVDTPAGLIIAACAVDAGIGAGRLPLGQLAKLLIPLFAIAAATVAFNAFGFTGDAAQQAGRFTAAGLGSGLFFGCRMVVLVAASFIVCFTTQQTALVDAFACLMGPLRALRVPVDDIALVLTLALRFIPVIAAELVGVRDAQLARGAHLSDGPFYARAKAWGSVFVPLFVGLYRRADVLGGALDARCYGAPAKRTSLDAHPFTARSAAVLGTGLSAIVVVAAVL